VKKSLPSLSRVAALIAGFAVFALAALDLASCNKDLEELDFVEAKYDAALPQISEHPQSIIRSSGEEAILTISASSPDGGSLSYQWFVDDDESGFDGLQVTEGTESTFALPADADSPGVHYYYVRITNTNVKATQNQTASINSEYAFVITAETIDMSAMNAPCEGEYWKYNGGSLKVLDGGFVKLTGNAACSVETAEGARPTLILHDFAANAFNLLGNVTLLLSGTNTLNNELGNFTALTIDSAAGTGSTSGTLYLRRINLPEGKSLTIQGGTVFAYQQPIMYEPPAIGTNQWDAFGTLRISGGAVVAGGVNRSSGAGAGVPPEASST